MNIWKFAQHALSVYNHIGWTATLHLPGSVKESKHVFKVNISKPKNDLYPQFREWRDTESFTYNYNDAWRQSSIMHLGTMAEKVRPEKALLERLKWTKSNSGTMIRQVAKIVSLKENGPWKMVYIRSKGWEQCFTL